MRTACLCLLACAAAGAALAAQEAGAGKRYGVALDLKAYPQASPKEALASALKAAEAGKFEYLVAHLADPAFVDDRVKRLYGGRFAEQVEDTQARLDAAALKQLKRFAADGTWAVEKAAAAVTLAEVKDRAVRLVKVGDRWYLSNRHEPPARD